VGSGGVFPREEENLGFQFRKGFIHRDEGDKRDADGNGWVLLVQYRKTPSSVYSYVFLINRLM
jgi:hypothetical protein